MTIDLYEFGLDMQLEEAVKILRMAGHDNLSKKDKNIKIAEAIGIIETVQMMIKVSEPENAQEADTCS